MDAVIIEKEALKLCEADRTLLADRLLLSISPESVKIREAWTAESEDRVRAYRVGELQAIDGPEALATLRARFSV